MTKVVRVFTGSDRNDLVRSLQKNSYFLASLTADFKHLHEEFDYLSVVESRGMLKVPLRTVNLLGDPSVAANFYLDRGR